MFPGRRKVIITDTTVIKAQVGVLSHKKQGGFTRFNEKMRLASGGAAWQKGMKTINETQCSWEQDIWAATKDTTQFMQRKQINRRQRNCCNKNKSMYFAHYLAMSQVSDWDSVAKRKVSSPRGKQCSVRTSSFSVCLKRDLCVFAYVTTHRTKRAMHSLNRGSKVNPIQVEENHQDEPPPS